MTVAEFIEKLRALPQDAEVVLNNEWGLYRAQIPHVDNAELCFYMSSTLPTFYRWEQDYSDGSPVKVVVID